MQMSHKNEAWPSEKGRTKATANAVKKMAENTKTVRATAWPREQTATWWIPPLS